MLCVTLLLCASVVNNHRIKDDLFLDSLNRCTIAFSALKYSKIHIGSMHKP
jgi:hypothetical protein